MEYRILGPLEVEAEAGGVALPRGRGRSLLALLILRAGEVIPTERLIDELWGPAPPRTATTALHGLVADLRRRLEPGRRTGQEPTVLRTRPPGYVLAADQGQIDAGRFRHMIEAAAGLPPEERAALLRQALGMWRGPALAEFTYEPFAQTTITALSELRLAATEDRVEADLACGRHAGLIGELQGLVAGHPLRERLRAHLMLALYRCGRQAEALETYALGRRTLVEELGIEPGQALRDLEQAILRQDHSLDVAPPQAAAGSTIEPRDAGRVAVRPWLTQGRKTVTVVFVDLAGVPGDRSDPEALRHLSSRGSAVAAEVLGKHGGTVEGVIGDVVVAVFGVPLAHEDDALRAVRAAAELRGALVSLNGEFETEGGSRLAARIGVNTGEVLVGDPGSQRGGASGDTVNVAARLQQAAADGDVLIGEATLRLVEGAIVVEPLDGQPVAGKGTGRAWRLVGLAQDSLARTPDLDAPLIGRETELAWLHTAFARTLREGHATLVAVVGDAGVGKSRLALEFTGAVAARARVLTGHCPSYGQGVAFWPLREILLAAGAEGIEGSAADLFPSVGRLFEALAEAQPLVVVVEDVHWAQPAFLDLLDYLAHSVRGPVLLLCLARPELLEEHPAWVPPRVALLHLEPLSDEDATTLVGERLARRPLLPAETVAKVVQTAQGNPLFVEQLVAALRDDRELSVPPSLQALLAARIDRAGPAERDLLRCASVVGTDFSLRALAALVPKEARPFLDRHLRRLEGREFVRPSGRHFLGEPARGFRHVLVQRAAYRSMTRTTRAELHERFARWLETGSGVSVLDTEELIGYHLEQAHVHRREAGITGQRTAALGVEAGERLASAGLRAYRRLDVAGAENLLARARTLLPLEHAQRREVMTLLAEAYPVLGRHTDADAVLAELLEDAGPDGGAGPDRWLLGLERARIRLLTGPDPIGLDAIRQEAEQVLEALVARDDQTGVARASFVLALVHRRKGAVTALEATARSGLAAAQRAGHAREEAGARWNVAWAVQAGPTAVPEAIRVCEGLAPLRETPHPGVLCELAILHAMLGEFDHARELITRTRRLMVERWRQRGPLLYPAAASGRVAMLAGDHIRAERELRVALDLATEMAVREHVSQVAATLTQVLAKAGRTGDAEHFAALSERAAPSESVASQALWRSAAGLVRSSRSEHVEAERLARAAAELAPLEMLNLRADLHAELAGVLVRAGQPAAARAAISEAAALYERKGNRVSGARARTLLAEIARGIGQPPRHPV